jgi:hypothetical protein
LAKPTNNLPDNLKSLIILKPFALYHFFEVAMLAKFSYYIEAVLGAEYILKLDDVGMIETLKEIYLGEYSILQVFIICECVEIHFFYSNFLFSVPFHTFENLTVYTFTQTMCCLIRVVTN